jgi:hypothetical protein
VSAISSIGVVVTWSPAAASRWRLAADGDKVMSIAAE